MALGSASGQTVSVSESGSAHTGRALAIVTTLFFMWGFLTTLNDTLIPHLKQIFTLNYTEAMLVQFSFFGSYFIFAQPAGKLIEIIGYKRTMVVGLGVMALGVFLFLPAAGAQSYPFFLAAEIVLAVEERARATGSIDTCGTVGKCQIYPGAVNSIPSRVEMDVDIRDTDEQRRNRVLREIEQACGQVAARRKLQVRVTPINADAPATCSPRVINALVEAAEENGLPYKKMVSRAYHDSLFMARIAPVGMVFIPCRGGVSHRPDEYSAPQEIETGAKVLASTLARLSQV